MRTHKAAVGMSEACFSCYPLLARAAKCARSSICRSRGCRKHSSLSSVQTLLSRPPPPLQWRLDCEVGFMCVKHGNIFRLNPPMRLFIGLCLKKKKKKLPDGLRHSALRAADRLEYSTQRIGLSSAGQLSLCTATKKLFLTTVLC